MEMEFCAMFRLAFLEKIKNFVFLGCKASMWALK